jgi:hypothetical protein
VITGLLAVVFIIGMIACAGNGEWGAFGVGAVIVILLLSLGSVSRRDDRAYNNFMDYWSEGGPDRKGMQE